VKKKNLLFNTNTLMGKTGMKM